ncbi:hypothetical protein CS542_08025 [Pedobacter sp. IW39]|nr:hypothetical protein CS542_08025 [Pedobacter sp. IW39]
MLGGAGGLGKVTTAYLVSIIRLRLSGWERPQMQLFRRLREEISRLTLPEYYHVMLLSSQMLKKHTGDQKSPGNTRSFHSTVLQDGLLKNMTEKDLIKLLF